MCQRTVTFGDNESIISILAEVPAHEAVVNRIHDFQAGEGRRDVQRADRLRNVENAAAMLPAPRPRGDWIELAVWR